MMQNPCEEIHRKLRKKHVLVAQVAIGFACWCMVALDASTRFDIHGIARTILWRHLNIIWCLEYIEMFLFFLSFFQVFYLWQEILQNLWLIGLPMSVFLWLFWSKVLWYVVMITSSRCSKCVHFHDISTADWPRVEVSLLLFWWPLVSPCGFDVPITARIGFAEPSICGTFVPFVRWSYHIWWLGAALNHIFLDLCNCNYCIHISSTAFLGMILNVRISIYIYTYRAP